MKKFPDHTIILISQIALGFLAAGAGGMIANMPSWIALAFFSIGILILLFVGLLYVNAPKRIIWFTLLGFGSILLLLVFFINRALSISPATKTITLYEMNNLEQWKGPENEPINLTLRNTLEAQDRPDNQERYILSPAIKHEINGETLRVTLTLKISSTDQLMPLSGGPFRREWIQKSVDGCIEYTTIIDSVTYGRPQKTNEAFFFKRSKPGSYKIIYKIVGTDSKGRDVKPEDLIVTMNLK